MYCEYIAESFALLLNFGQEAVYCNLEIYIHSPQDEFLNLTQKKKGKNYYYFMKSTCISNRYII